MTAHPFTEETLEHTTEYHLSGHPASTQGIYIIVVLGLLGAFVILPFVNIDVSVKSSGILKATTERTNLKALNNGYIQSMFVKEHQPVKEGQLLFTTIAPVFEERERNLVARLAEINRFPADLEKLLRVNKAIVGSELLATALYRQAFVDYQQKLLDRQVRFAKATQDYERNKKLYEQKVIAAAEFENFQFEFNKAQNELEMLKQTQLNQWQQELRVYQKEIIELSNQLAQVRKEIESLQIKAPVSGTIQNLIGIYPGSTVFAGQELAQISPDGVLQAEVYVSPNDIGLLREGMAVRMQVGAFNYNQWGLLHGKVKEISNDIQIMDNRPVFEVKCSLEKDHLTLKNGYQGKLKKGMTLQARFVVTQRSLWQLLYDKADDWLNPNIISGSIQSR